jgi:hypothetical protein
MATFLMTASGELSRSDAIFTGAPNTAHQAQDMDRQVETLANQPGAVQHQIQATISVAQNGNVRLSRTQITSSLPKDGKRCAICVFNYCPNRNSCSGMGGRKLCRCAHSRTPQGGRSVRNINEERITQFLDANPGLSQSEREALL